MVHKVELFSISPCLERKWEPLAYLYDIMAHLEYNNMFHAKVLLHKVHALRSRLVSIGIIMRAVQPLEHVPLEMSQEVCLVA